MVFGLMVRVFIGVLRLGRAGLNGLIVVLFQRMVLVLSTRRCGIT